MLDKLAVIQSELKAPKGQYNSFGKYKYRSAEDILEAVKPLLLEAKCVLTLGDEIVMVGDRYYVKATATIRDCDSDNAISVSAFAREDNEKKGADLSQLTGACSSYARKYALNGLFCIDDTKDADTNQFVEANSSVQEYHRPTELTYREKVMIAGDERGLSAKDLAAKYGLTRETTEERFKEVLAELEG